MDESKNLIITKGTAIELLRRLFGDNPKTNTLKLEQVYSNAGRANTTDDSIKKRNRRWLNTVLAKLKTYNFVTTVNGFVNGRFRTISLKLTPEGMEVLSKQQTKTDTSLQSAMYAKVNDSSTAEKTVDVGDIMNTIDVLRTQHPSWEIVFEIRHKGGRV